MEGIFIYDRCADCGRNLTTADYINGCCGSKPAQTVYNEGAYEQRQERGSGY